MNKALTIIRDNWGVVFGILYFGAWFIFNSTNVPFLDANLDFIKGVSYYTGGIKNLGAQFSSVHPPGKELFLSLSFAMFGISSFSYYIITIPFLLIGIISAKRLGERIYNDPFAGNIAAVVLSTSPLFIAVGVQGLTDFLVACLFLFILKNAFDRNLPLTIIGVCLALSIKETAIAILPAIMISYLIPPGISLRTKIYRIGLLVLIPILVLFGWKFFLESQGSGLWHVWVFGQSTQTDAVGTVVSNLLHFRLVNKYSLENIKHLFFLNFNWVYWFAWIVSIIKFGIKRQIPLLVAIISYTILVLSFPTYSIPRYILPVMVLNYVGMSGVFISMTRNPLPLTLVVIFIFVQSFYSVDPVSLWIWPAPDQYSRFWVFKQTLYSLDAKISGNDRITYNIQSLLISTDRTKILKTMQNATKINSPDCVWISRDPDHDLFTLRTLGIFKGSTFPECNRKL